MKLRQATIADVASFMHIKNSLPMPCSESKNTHTGGFLLGTTEAGYRFYIENGFCMVAESDKEVVGFGIILPNQLIKASEIWQKRDLAQWYIPIETLENKQLCYFEQLAFLPHHSKPAATLAFSLANKAFLVGHDALFTTTVRKPIANLAAVPFIKAVGGTLIGNINEHYDEIGAINSDIYLIEKEKFYAHTSNLEIIKHLKNS